ncbi:MAG: hypothetical protein PQJ50_09805 [Spirochaetales bacterium]|nr:hypothetical protein [Spirochaetales bacterium]
MSEPARKLPGKSPGQKPRISLIHTTPLVLPAVEEALAPLKGEYDFFHTLDEGILYKMMKDGNSAELASPWLGTLVDQAVKAEAAMIIVTCSSLSPYVADADSKAGVPVVRIDEMMYRRVASKAENPAVLMTNPTNRVPAALMAEETEKLLGLKESIPMNLCPGAFEALKAGDAAAHDRAVVDETVRLLQTHDHLIYSQISMARVRSLLPKVLQSRIHVSLDYLKDILADALDG